MPKKNAYLEKQRRRDDLHLEIAEETIKQLMLDTLQIAIHQEFGWGFDRIVRLTTAWGGIYSHYVNCVRRREDADVYQHHLDECLKEIMKDRMELIPFPERYPHIKKARY